MNIESLEKTLKYKFKDPSLLQCALTHRSVVGAVHNERLEFLGDAILGKTMAEFLYRRYPDASEGELSRIRASLVRGECLAEIADHLELGQYLILGPGEKKSGGRKRRSILANTLESIVGAIYLDAGPAFCEQWLLSIYGDRLFKLVEEVAAARDAKSALQEWAQANQFPLPIYEATASGAAHEQHFFVTCTIEGLPHKTEGQSTSRRQAEQAAARAFLELINE